MAEYLQEDDGQITIVLACELFFEGLTNLTAFRHSSTQCHFLPHQEIRPGLTNGMINFHDPLTRPRNSKALQGGPKITSL